MWNKGTCIRYVELERDYCAPLCGGVQAPVAEHQQYREDFLAVRHGQPQRVVARAEPDQEDRESRRCGGHAGGAVDLLQPHREVRPGV